MSVIVEEKESGALCERCWEGRAVMRMWFPDNTIVYRCIKCMRAARAGSIVDWRFYWIGNEPKHLPNISR